MTSEDRREAAKAVGPLPAGHPPVRTGKVGVLLVNLGTPDGTDFKPMWRYLREFLSDKRVIELPRAIWYPILYGIVLTTRPKKSGANYARIWNRERDESPLRTYYARPGREACRRARRPARGRRRMGHALRQPVDGERGAAAEGPGLRAHRLAAALPAIFGDDDGDRQRPAVPRADEDAPRAGRAHRAALS